MHTFMHTCAQHSHTHVHTHACTHTHTQTCENTGNPLTAGNKNFYQYVPIQQVRLHNEHDMTGISHTNNTTPQQHNNTAHTSDADSLRSRNFFSGATIIGLILAVG